MKKREAWIDVLKGLALIWIFFVHYTNEYMKPIIDKIYYGKLSFIMKGFSGKFAVALFAVILGYLAAKKAEKIVSVSNYILKRYLQFAIPLLVVSTVTAIGLYAVAGIGTFKEQLVTILKESLLFSGNSLCPPAWCLVNFLQASVIIVVTANKKYTTYIQLLCVLVFYLCSGLFVWTACCIVGALLFRLQKYVLQNNEQKIVKLILNPIFKVILIALSILVIQRDEGPTTFLLDSFACCAVVFVILGSDSLKKILSIKPLAAFGRVSMEFFLIHVAAYTFVHWVMYKFIGESMSAIGFYLVSMLVAFAASVAVSLAFNWLLKTKPFMLPYRLIED